MNANAVIVRAGHQSTHAHWVLGETPNFDLIVAAYEDLPLSLTSQATETILIPGTKVAGWATLFDTRPGILDRYARIALLDDDLICSSTELNTVFNLGEIKKLSLWQPSLSWDSYFSYAIFLHNPLFSLRYVNFIEMMCPFFTSKHLRLSMPLFKIGLETGIDRLWCRLIENWRGAYAIVDDVQFKHTRAVGTNRLNQGFSGKGNDYQSVTDEMQLRMGVNFRGPVAYGGIGIDGSHIGGRTKMAMRSLITLAAWRTKVNRGWFYRPILDHVRHNLTRPIDNELLNLDEIINKFRHSIGTT